MAPPSSPPLSSSQLATLAKLGKERTANVGDVLFQVGDRTYPFIAILKGEAAIIDAAGNEMTRHGASKFLGEITLLSGQTVFLTAVVVKPMRYIAVDRDVFRSLLFDDAGLADLVLTTFIARREALQGVQGVGTTFVSIAVALAVVWEQPVAQFVGNGEPDARWTPRRVELDA